MNGYVRPPPMQHSQVQMPVPMQQPAAPARRIYRLPSQPSPPSSSSSSPVIRTNPPPPMLTTKRRQALETAAVELQKAIRSGQVVQDATQTAPIDDSGSVLGDQKTVLDALPITALLQFVPAGVRVSSLLALIDPSSL
jgi:hypothetical protein